MWEDLGRALCLVLVIEGILPFLHPQRFRHLVAMLADMNDRSVRLIGLASMMLGLAIMMLIP